MATLFYSDRAVLEKVDLSDIMDVEAQVCSVAVIIFEIRTKNVSQVIFVQYDDMICTFSPDRADHSFNKRVLPRALRGRYYFFDAHVFRSIAKENAIDRIPIPHQILGRRIPGQGLHDLLGCPLGGRI